MKRIPRTGKLSFRPASGGRRSRARLTIDIATLSSTPLVGAPSVHQSSPRRVGTVAEDGGRTAVWSTTISGTRKTVRLCSFGSTHGGIEQDAVRCLVDGCGKKLGSGAVLPRHCDCFVCVGHMELRYIRRMGNLSEVRQRFRAQTGAAVLLLPQVPGCGSNDPLQAQSQTSY